MPPSLVVESLDPLPGEEVLLRVLHLGGIVEGRVHVPVTMSVRDPLHGLGGCFAESDRRPDSLHQKELLLLPEPLAFFLCFPPLLFLVLVFLCPFLDSLLDQPKTEARQRRGYAVGDNDCCYVYVFTS